MQTKDCAQQRPRTLLLSFGQQFWSRTTILVLETKKNGSHTVSGLTAQAQSAN